jgi:hypothetical protein
MLTNAVTSLCWLVENSAGLHQSAIPFAPKCNTQVTAEFAIIPRQERSPEEVAPMTIDLELFEKTPLTREPFEHLVVREFVKP